MSKEAESGDFFKKDRDARLEVIRGNYKNTAEAVESYLYSFSSLRKTDSLKTEFNPKNAFLLKFIAKHANTYTFDPSLSEMETKKVHSDFEEWKVSESLNASLNSSELMNMMVDLIQALNIEDLAEFSRKKFAKYNQMKWKYIDKPEEIETYNIYKEKTDIWGKRSFLYGKAAAVSSKL